MDLDQTSINVPQAVAGEDASVEWIVAHFQPMVESLVRVRLLGIPPNSVAVRYRIHDRERSYGTYLRRIISLASTLQATSQIVGTAHANCQDAVLTPPATNTKLSRCELCGASGDGR